MSKNIRFYSINKKEYDDSYHWMEKNIGRDEKSQADKILKKIKANQIISTSINVRVNLTNKIKNRN